MKPRKGAVPVKRYRRSRVLDLAACERAIREGTLSEADARSFDAILPGVRAKLLNGTGMIQCADCGKAEVTGAFIRCRECQLRKDFLAQFRESHV